MAYNHPLAIGFRSDLLLANNVGLFSFNSGRMWMIFANNSGRKYGCLQAATVRVG